MRSRATLVAYAGLRVKQVVCRCSVCACMCVYVRGACVGGCVSHVCAHVSVSVFVTLSTDVIDGYGLSNGLHHEYMP